MKIDGFRLEELAPGVTLWACGREDVPLRALLEKPVAVLTDEKSLEPTYEQAKAKRNQQPGTMILRAAGEERHVQGFIVASRPAALVDLLARSWIPSGETELDRLVRTHERDEGALRSALDGFVGRLAATFAAEKECPIRVVVGEAALDQATELYCHLFEVDGRGFAARAAFAPLLARAGRSVQVASRALPRLEWVFVPPDEQTPMLFFDGKKLGSAQKIDDIPERLLARLERDCELGPPLPGLFAGPAGVRPLFVCRIPRRLLAPRRGPSIVPAGEPHPALAQGALLFDARTTVPIDCKDGPAPLIEDEVSALYLLEHVVPGSRIYVPGPPVHAPDRLEVETLVEAEPATAPGPLSGVLASWMAEGDADLFVVGAMPEPL